MAKDTPTIRDVVAAAGAPGHAHCKAVLGAVSPWLAEQAAARGFDISGFKHTIDTSSVRHIISHDGEDASEISRGYIAIRSGDIANIPEILAAPDKIIFGAKNRQQQHLVGTLKSSPAGTILFLQEVRPGRMELAAVTMRLYPATIDAVRIAASCNLYGRTEGGTTIHIVDVPENVTALSPLGGPAAIGAHSIAGRAAHHINDLPESGRSKRRLKKYLPPALGLLVLCAIIFGLHHALAKVRVANVLAALSGTPRQNILHAFLLLGASFLVMAVYDIPGILFARKLVAMPRIGLARVALASSCAYALSHVLGAPALSGAAVRLRLYAQWGVPPSGIGRIVALSGTMFTLGVGALLGGILILHPADLPLFGHAVSTPALRAAGAACWAAALAYILIAGQNRPVVVFGKAIPRPGFGLAVMQILLSCADTSIACGILYAVLPDAPGVTYARVLGLYLAGFAGGLFTGLPGGAGVFDTILLLGLAGFIDPARAIGAILLFRVLYYLLPAAVTALGFGLHEIWITTRRDRK